MLIFYEPRAKPCCALLSTRLSEWSQILDYHDRHAKSIKKNQHNLCKISLKIDAIHCTSWLKWFFMAR